MKQTRIGINGFGRIGRLTYRAAWNWPEFEWVVINDPKGGVECAAHLLTFDSVQGRWSQEAIEEVNALPKAAAESAPLKGILAYETRALASIDFKGNPASATIDALFTMVVNKRLVKIYAWHDNEWGHSNRLAELTRKVAGSL